MNINRFRFILLSIVTVGGVAAAATLITISETRKQPEPEKPPVTVPMVPGTPTPDTATPTPDTDDHATPPSGLPSTSLTNEQAQKFAVGFVRYLDSISGAAVMNFNPKGTIEGTWLVVSCDVSVDAGISTSNYLYKFNLTPQDDGNIEIQILEEGILKETDYTTISNFTAFFDKCIKNGA